MNRRLEPRSHAEADELLRELVAEGYVRTSRKFGHVSRIDRPDWKDWAEMNGSPISPEFFRRVNSRDRIVLPVDLALRMPTHTEPPHYKPPRKHGRDRDTPRTRDAVNPLVALTGCACGRGGPDCWCPSEPAAPPPRRFGGLGKVQLVRPQCPECNGRHGPHGRCYGGFNPDDDFTPFSPTDY